MSNMSKQKGKRGEKDFTQELSHILGRIKERKRLAGHVAWGHGPKAFVDVQANGTDIQSIDGLSIEVKRQEVLAVKAWWRQAERQSDDMGAIPILVYRQNRKAWSVCLPAYLLGLGVRGYVVCDLETFEDWLFIYLN